MKHSSIFRRTLNPAPHASSLLASGVFALTGMLPVAGCGETEPSGAAGADASWVADNNAVGVGSSAGPADAGEPAGPADLDGAGMVAIPNMGLDGGLATPRDVDDLDAGMPKASADAGFPTAESSCEELTYETFGEEFLGTYCTGCHGGAMPMGGFALESEKAIVFRADNALRQVRSGGMPRGSTVLSTEQQATFIAWMECELERKRAASDAAGGGGEFDDRDEFAGLDEDEDIDEDLEDELDEDIEEEADEAADLDEDIEEDIEEEADEAADLDEDLDEDLEDAIDERNDD